MSKLLRKIEAQKRNLHTLIAFNKSLSEKKDISEYQHGEAMGRKLAYQDALRFLNDLTKVIPNG